jgi:DNA-binding transcriptional LysR family regulator
LDEVTSARHGGVVLVYVCAVRSCVDNAGTEGNEQRSFDAAAERLHVTPSAVSQRIKALEQRVGEVLVVREKPCTATAAGVPLLRLAAQTALLETEAPAEMGGGDGSSPRIAATAIRHGV